MTIQQFAVSKGLNWEVHQSTANGATLKQHWNNEKGLKTRKLVKRKKYGHIIFQEHSVYPIQLIDTTQKYLNKIVDLTWKETKSISTLHGYIPIF